MMGTRSCATGAAAIHSFVPVDRLSAVTVMPCRASIRGSSEKFQVVDAGDGRIALKSMKQGKYCAAMGYTIKCDRYAAATSSFHHVDSLDLTVMLHREKIGAQEKFRVKNENGGGGGSLEPGAKVTLQGPPHGEQSSMFCSVVGWPWRISCNR